MLSCFSDFLSANSIAYAKSSLDAFSARPKFRSQMNSQLFAERSSVDLIGIAQSFLNLQTSHLCITPALACRFESTSGKIDVCVCKCACC